MPTVKTKSSKTSREQKALARIDKLFRELEDDKSLPTFGEFFVLCIVLGVEKCVDLRKMYPKTYKKLRRQMAACNCI